MDIGIGHVIKANGELITAYWDTFNPNLALGAIHEIVMFDYDIELKDIFDNLDDGLVREEFIGEFNLISRKDTIETYQAKYQITLQTAEPNVHVKNFVFLSDGRPWAICRLTTAIELKPSIETVFAFESSIVINNKLDIVNEPWVEKVGKFKIEYGAMVSAVNNNDGIVLASNSGLLEPNLTNDDIIKNVSKYAKEIHPQFIFEEGRIGICLEAKSNEDVKGVKAIFIRILWNMGILIFIKSVEWDGNKLENLTLVKGHKLKLMFGIRFKEMKNATTI